MLTVMASGRDLVSGGEVALVDLLVATRRVQLDQLDVFGIVEAGHRGVIEGQVAVLPDAQAAKIEGMLAQKRAW